MSTASLLRSTSRADVNVDAVPHLPLTSIGSLPSIPAPSQTTRGLGDRRLLDLRPSEIKDWASEMIAEGLKPSTVYSNYRRLAQMLGDAANDGLIPRSPCSRRTSPRQPTQRPFVPTTEEVFALLDAMPDHLQPAVLLGAFAGLRISEAVALTSQDVDFIRGVVTPARRGPARQHGDQPLKSPASSAPIPIPHDLALELSAALERGGGTHLVTDAAGRPATPWAVRRAITAAKAADSVIPAELRFHDLRHYYAACSSPRARHEGRPGPSAARERHHDPERLRAPVAGRDESSRAAVGRRGAREDSQGHRVADRAFCAGQRR